MEIKYMTRQGSRVLQAKKYYIAPHTASRDFDLGFGAEREFVRLVRVARGLHEGEVVRRGEILGAPDERGLRRRMLERHLRRCAHGPEVARGPRPFDGVAPALPECVGVVRDVHARRVRKLEHDSRAALLAKPARHGLRPFPRRHVERLRRVHAHAVRLRESGIPERELDRRRRAPTAEALGSSARSPGPRLGRGRVLEHAHRRLLERSVRRRLPRGPRPHVGDALPPRVRRLGSAVARPALRLPRRLGRTKLDRRCHLVSAIDPCSRRRSLIHHTRIRAPRV
mmetsp:Transcript_30775/g.100175  ORF Transcript_30775/g.100175 Transcript_30775/m.100175 type:complete len:283 (-) Transcript_30775:584-1432(-)